MTSEAIRNEILKANAVLKKGGIILYPTDTVWGLGCDATRTKAVEKIYNLKKRPVSKGFIVLLDQFEKIYNYVDEVPDITPDLISSFDKPLTIIYRGAKNLAKNLIHPDGSIAIRIVRDEFCKNLVQLFGKPLVSTSANISGEPTPLIYQKINPDIISGVDYIVKINQNCINQLKPSTIIKFIKGNEYTIIRG